MGKTIHICLISDADYAACLRIAMISILAAAEPEDSLCFHLVDGGLGAENRRKISKLQAIKPFECHYLEADPALLSRLPHHRCAPCAYYRVLLPRLLPQLERIIYLDCDLIALSSLTRLWQTDLNGLSVAAAPDFIDYVKFEESNFLHLTGFGFEPRHTYFNSGVMLLDLEKMRRDNFDEKFFAARARLEGRIRYSDQDVLNYLFQDDCLVLPQDWNFQAPMCLLPEDKLDVGQVEMNIIHYTTEAKPWLEGSLCFLVQEYQAVAQVAKALAV